MLRTAFGIVLLASLNWGACEAATCPAVPVPLTNGTTANADNVITDLNSILTCANGSLAPLDNPHLTGSVVIQSATSYPLRVFSPNTPTSSAVAVDTPATGEQAAILFSSNGSGKWQFGKHTDDRFFLYDATAARNDISISAASNMSLMPTSGYVGIGTANPTTELAVLTSAASSAREKIATYSVADAGNDVLILGNGSSADGHLQPAFAGYVDSGPGLASAEILALTSASQDIATNAIGIFDVFAARTSNASNPLGGSFSPIVSKNLFSVRNTQTQLLTVAPNGNVGIGTTLPGYLLDVGSSSSSGVVARFTNSTGSCTINPTATSLSCSSDSRLKKDFEAIDPSYAIGKIWELSPTRYKWKREGVDSGYHAGFLAEDVQSVFPDLVSKDPSGYRALNYAGMMPYLVAGVQSVDDRIAELETKNAQQAKTIASLQKQISDLRLMLSSIEHGGKLASVR